MGKNDDTSKISSTSSYVGAPYNFIPFSEVKSVYADKPPAHNSMESKLISGEIEYEMTAQTPIFTDDGKCHFHKDANGQYSIPGSSIRGLIRNNVQILGCASLNDDIDDYALMYRDVTNTDKKSEKGTEQYSAILGIGSGAVGIPTKEKAGYLVKEGTYYYIYPTCLKKIKKEWGEVNYYTVSEKEISERAKKFSYEFFKKGDKWISQAELDKGFQQVKPKHYEAVQENEAYVPYYKKASYSLDKTEVTAIGESGVYEKEGVVVSSGKMKEKKAIYIIPEIDRDLIKERIEIPKEDIESFKIDFKRRENTLGGKQEKKFFDLPEEGEEKPVFYLQEGFHVYFGFTPRLRIFYKYKIKDGLPDSQRKDVIDYAKAIFGYSNKTYGGKQQSYKSRVSFSDAVICGGDNFEQKKTSVILAEPKPTSYLDYLLQNLKKTSYNTDKFQLRGVKQYWLHSKTVLSKDAEEKENVKSDMYPLPKGVKFIGKVRFKNLTEEELGLLLWAIRLEKDSWMNIGKAKSFGYGCVSVRIKSARKINYEKAYNIQSMLDLAPFDEINVEQAIDNYKAIVAGWGEMEKSHISDFFKMKDSTKIPNEKDIRYMSVDDGEYQKRLNALAPLPSIDDVIKRRKS